MPVGTVTQDAITRELRTLPPDGFVKLRKLPYGQMLKRRDMGSRMIMEQRLGRKQRRTDDDTQKVEMELLQETTRAYEFANCIVDHNITDPNGRQLNFANVKDMASLDPKVGQEIERYIDELNRDIDEDEEFEDFPQQLNSSLEEELTSSMTTNSTDAQSNGLE